MTSRSCVVAGLSLAIAAVLGGCSASEGVGSAAGCALVVEFDGRVYEGSSVEVAPVEGRPLGSAALPGCNDTGEGVEGDERIEVARFPGVPPRVALVWQGHHDTVLVRRGVHGLPPEVRRLLDAPRCDPRDAPITLAGPWLGILEADGETELDLVPPYDISMFVKQSSAREYLRAFLDVRVPPGEGRPLLREDIRKSLWEGGAVRVVAICRGGHYAATSVRAFAP